MIHLFFPLFGGPKHPGRGVCPAAISSLPKMNDAPIIAV